MANNNIANVNKNDLGFLGEEYQKLFVKCLIEDKQYFGELYSVLDQNKFTNENLRRIVGFMKDRYAEVEIVPSYSDLKVIIRSRVSDEISRNIMISMLKEIYDIKMESIDLIEDTCFKFFKQQNLIKALKETEDIRILSAWAISTDIMRLWIRYRKQSKQTRRKTWVLDCSRTLKVI